MSMIDLSLGVPTPDVYRSDFPSDFMFGASTSALQTEGTTGRGPCTWDLFIPGGTAVDSYHRYKEDVEMLKFMSVTTYRFSISWSRILPKGTLSGGINQDAIRFYNDLINELVANKIQPFVTLFHFDLPQALQDEYNGFLSRKIIDDFKDYAKICFDNFGDRVKYWATFNEPHVFGAYGYSIGGSFENNGTTMPYIATHNTILAHATVATLYKEKYQASQGGEIGLSLMIQCFLPFSESLHDSDAVDRALSFMVGWYMGPLVTGDYPFIMKAIVRDRLPTFTYGEKLMVKRSYDFITINYYTARYAEALPLNPNDIPVSYDQDHYAHYYVSKTGERLSPFAQLIPVIGPGARGADDVSVYPIGLKEVLIHMKNRYQNPKIFITENGTGEPRDDAIPLSKALEDPHRIDYVKNHLNFVKEAISDGVNVKGYFIWSLIDGMEPDQGYTLRMGLIYIDYLNRLKRIPKKSATWLRDFMTI